VYSGVPRVNRGKTGKMQVDTPESDHTVCIIFGKVNLNTNLKSRAYSNQTHSLWVRIVDIV